MAESKIFDPIHGFIAISPLMKRILATPEMHRLRDLKQLGATSYVFPGATHTRLSHSIGVSHLAGLVMTVLRTNHPELAIRERDIELARIAGLVHDLGHGPYSHLYDDRVIGPEEPKHEVRGCKMFREMVRKYQLQLRPQEVDMVTAMVNPSGEQIHNWRYQIVANKACQVDVDKIDYLQRDVYYLGLKYGGEYSRLLTEGRVCRVDSVVGRPTREIAWPEKLQYEIFSLFATRYRLHKQVYNHPVVKAHEFCLVEIMRGLRRKGVPFMQLTDATVLCRTRASAPMLQTLANRDVPKLVGETVKQRKPGPVAPSPRTILDLIIDEVKIGFGGGENPLARVNYYGPECNQAAGWYARLLDPQKASFCIPALHEETLLRLYTTDRSREGIARAQDHWKQLKNTYALMDTVE